MRGWIRVKWQNVPKKSGGAVPGGRGAGAVARLFTSLDSRWGKTGSVSDPTAAWTRPSSLFLFWQSGRGVSILASPIRLYRARGWFYLIGPFVPSVCLSFESSDITSSEWSFINKMYSVGNVSHDTLNFNRLISRPPGAQPYLLKCSKSSWKII